MAKTKKDYLEDYINSEAFKYDLEDDPVYEALKRTYSESAKKTAEDILGKYSQLSGLGSVSSAAISAAGQGANSELGKLREQIPELYALAREMYDEDMAEKERRYKAYLEYEKSLEKNNSVSDGGKDAAEDKGQENLPEKEEDKTGGENALEENPSALDEGFSHSKGENGITTGSLAAGAAPKHQMDASVYGMTKNLVRTYISVGRVGDAEKLYSKFKGSMSDSQRLEIEKLLGSR